MKNGMFTGLPQAARFKLAVLMRVAVVGVAIILLVDTLNRVSRTKDRIADREVKRAEKALSCLNLQLAAQSSYTSAVTLELQAVKRGDTNTAMFWRSNAVVFDRMEREAYRDLKALTP